MWGGVCVYSRRTIAHVLMLFLPTAHSADVDNDNSCQPVNQPASQPANEMRTSNAAVAASATDGQHYTSVLYVYM